MAEFTGTCPICGKEMPVPEWGPGPFRGVCLKCFDHRYWDIIVKEKHEHIVVNGVCYKVYPEKSTSTFRGCGGRIFYIQMLTANAQYSKGDTFATTNLWAQGSIPKSHLEQLPDTAKFITKEQYDYEGSLWN